MKNATAVKVCPMDGSAVGHILFGSKIRMAMGGGNA